VNLLVRREPLKHLLAPGNPGSVWANVIERDTIKLRRKKADRIGSPRRRENDSCSRPAHQIFEDGQEIGVYDVRELTWIGVASEFRTPSMSRKITFIPHERS
jgi:hypothetical protein